MKTTLRFLGVCFALQLAAASAAFAAKATTYQVTGPIVGLTPSTLTIEKDGERWEVARDSETKAAEPLKLGQRVTVHYRMNAVSVEVKPASSDTDEPGKKSEKRAKSENKSSSSDK
jgi:hypothetical protein